MSTNRRMDEESPLLGNGESNEADKVSKSLAHNLITWTALVAQIGVLVLAGTVFYGIFTHDMIFMSSHPLLNSAGVVLIVEAILILQPTESPQQKRAGAITHSVLNSLGSSALFAGLIIIEINKGDHARFDSLHGRLGLTTYILIFIQGNIGAAMYYVPQLFGGEEKAKSVWKYHRLSGYLVLASLTMTATAATLTPYIKEQVEISIWPVLVGSVLVLAGVLPGIRKQKLGF